MRLFMYKFIYLLSLAVRWDGWISLLLREIIFCSVLPQPIGKLNSLDLSFDQKTNFARKCQRCCHPHVYFYFRSHFSLHCVSPHIYLPIQRSHFTILLDVPSQSEERWIARVVAILKFLGNDHLAKVIRQWLPEDSDQARTTRQICPFIIFFLEYR